MESVFSLFYRVDARIAVPMFTGWRSTSAGSGRCDDKRVAHHRSTRASSERIFLTIYHFIDVLIFFFFFLLDSTPELERRVRRRRSRPDSARVDAASERATNDQRCGAPFFLYFFLVVIRSTVVLPMIFCVFGDFLKTGAHHDDPFCRVDRPRHDNDARC
ncbi:MAG: hypothetical protein IPK60_20645 [Sandaracinaceae bacterium]|nr:hypothetical protein [Sandaracinaceae bacterium]